MGTGLLMVTLLKLPEFLYPGIEPGPLELTAAAEAATATAAPDPLFPPAEPPIGKVSMQ